MAFTYNRKSLKKNPTNFSSTHMRICVKDATPLGYAANAGAFSSPEPLGLICNRPVTLVSRPRDQETTGSGDENDAGGNFSEQGNYLFRLPLLDCLYKFPTKRAKGITGSYTLFYSWIKCPMNFAHHTKHEANIVGYWPSYYCIFTERGGSWGQ